MNSHRAVSTKTAVLLGWFTLILSHVPQSASISCGKNSVNVENQLKQSLLCNGYRSEARPRKDPAQTVNLTVAFFVMGYDFDEEDDLLELNVWFNLQWNDEFLVWNRTEWNGIERMAINSDDIWLPDFRHFSSYYNPEELPDCTNPACSVAWNGSVYCVPRCNMNAKCSVSYNRWPFDVHECNLWYGTWVNSMNEVDMHTEELCLQAEPDFSSPRWSIVSLEKNRAVVKSSDEYMYTILKMDLMLQRKNGFETVAVLCPIMVLAFLNLYIVWLRSSCIERKLLLTLSMACHFGFLQQIQWVLPYNGDTIPELLVFLQSSVIITGLLVFVTLLNCWTRVVLSRESTSNGSWFGRFMGIFSQNRVAELILAADYLELSYQVTKDESDHGLQVAKLLDRMVAITCLVIYVVLLLVYIPFGYQQLPSTSVKSSISCGKDSVNVENQLKQSLLCNGYRSEARPRKDPAQTVNLTVSFFVMGYDFNEYGDLLELNVWYNMKWNDEFLVWNQTEWNDISWVVINSDEIWLPDFQQMTSYYTPEKLTDCTNPFCSVAWNGSVLCAPRCNMNAKCDASYNRWPYDVHECDLWYGTRMTTMNAVDMHTEKLCLQVERDFSNPRWSIVSLEKNRAWTKNRNNISYVKLSMDLMLQRKNGFDTVAVLCPIMVLAFLNLYIVWLRSSCIERKLLLTLSMACHFGFLQQIQWVLPYNRDTIPGLLVFLQSSVIITGLLVFVTLLNCWTRVVLSRESTSNGSWFGRFMGIFSQNRVAELILAADYLELSYQVTKDESDHGLQVAKLFDRVVAIACLVIYVLLLLVYIPFGYQDLSDADVECMFFKAP